MCVDSNRIFLANRFRLELGECQSKKRTCVRSSHLIHFQNANGLNLSHPSTTRMTEHATTAVLQVGAVERRPLSSWLARLIGRYQYYNPIPIDDFVPKCYSSFLSLMMMMNHPDVHLATRSSARTPGQSSLIATSSSRCFSSPASPPGPLRFPGRGTVRCPTNLRAQLFPDPFSTRTR